jgi:DNA-binding transcriptional LysR family regulator
MPLDACRIFTFMDNSEIRLLRVFAVLMRERSVSRTADNLGLSQPATSHLLARLRKLLGDPLLLRSRNSMVPTERALEIEKSVQALLDDYDRITRPAEPFDPAVSRRTFQLSIPEFAERYLLPPLFRKIRKEAPQVRIVVRPPNQERAYELLERGDLDIRVAWLPTSVASLRSVQLFQDHLVCIADRKHPAIHSGVLTLENFLTLPHLRTAGYTQTTTGAVIDAAIEKQGRKLLMSQVVQNFVTMPNAIPGTDLIATVPRLLAEEFASRHPLQILEPPLQLPVVKYAAYWHERTQRDAGHRWLRSALAQAGRSIHR